MSERYAEIKDGAVVNIALATAAFAMQQEWVAAGEAGIGDLWDGKSFSPAPEPPGPVPAWPRFVGNAKLDLFTRDEQLAVVTATMSDPTVKLFYDRMLGAAFLSYEDPETEQGLALLESKGLLTAVRKAEIVAAMRPA